MPFNGVYLPGVDVAAQMGTRVAEWLRREYPDAAAKRIARDLDASPHTTRRWLEGALPESRHLAAMARRWGGRFLAFVYAPAIDADALLSAQADVRDIRLQLDRLEARLGQPEFVAAETTLAGRSAGGRPVPPAQAARPLAPVPGRGPGGSLGAAVAGAGGD